MRFIKTTILAVLLICLVASVAFARGPTVKTTNDNATLNTAFDGATDANPATWDSDGATSNLASMDLQGSATIGIICPRQTQHRSTVELTAANVANSQSASDSFLLTSLYSNNVDIGPRVNGLTKNDNRLFENNTSLNNRNWNENSFPLLFISETAEGTYSLPTAVCF